MTETQIERIAQITSDRGLEDEAIVLDFLLYVPDPYDCTFKYFVMHAQNNMAVYMKYYVNTFS